MLLDVERFQHVIEDVPIFGQQLSRLEQILHQLPEVTLGTGPEGEKKTRSNSQFGFRPGSGRLTGAAHRPDVVHVMFQRRCHLVSCQRGCPRNTDKKKEREEFFPQQGAAVKSCNRQRPKLFSHSSPHTQSHTALAT